MKRYKPIDPQDLVGRVMHGPGIDQRTGRAHSTGTHMSTSHFDADRDIGGFASTMIGMSRKDLARYSIVGAIRAAATGKQDDFTRETSDAVAKKLGRQPKGFFVPEDVVRGVFAEDKEVSDAHVFARLMETIHTRVARLEAGGSNRALSAGIGTAGGFTISEDVLGSSMIELLRKKMVIAQMGARTLSGLVGNVSIPKQTGGSTATWGEEGGDLTPSQQTVGQLGLIPHTVGALTEYSKQLLSQSSIDIEGFVRQDLVTSIAIERDRVAIEGTGAVQPLGLINVTGINSLTFGGAATWSDAVEFETLIATDNADVNTMAFVTTPAVRGKWKTVVKEAGQANYLWGDSTGSNRVNGYRAEVTNQTPGDRVIFGDWGQIILADWAGLDIVVDPFTLAAKHRVRVIVHQMCDVGVRHPQGFAVSSDSGAQ